MSDKLSERKFEMEKKSTGILIDPAARTITSATYLSWRDISRLCECDCFTTLRVGDDEGLIGGRDLPLFSWRGYSQPLAGKALLLGIDEIGETISTSFTLASVASCVTWRPDLKFSHMEHSEGLSTHPIFGSIPTFTSTAKFRRVRGESAKPAGSIFGSLGEEVIESAEVEGTLPPDTTIPPEGSGKGEA